MLRGGGTSCTTVWQQLSFALWQHDQRYWETIALALFDSSSVVAVPVAAWQKALRGGWLNMLRWKFWEFSCNICDGFHIMWVNIPQNSLFFTRALSVILHYLQCSRLGLHPCASIPLHWQHLLPQIFPRPFFSHLHLEHHALYDYPPFPCPAEHHSALSRVLSIGLCGVTWPAWSPHSRAWHVKQSSGNECFWFSIAHSLGLILEGRGVGARILWRGRGWWAQGLGAGGGMPERTEKPNWLLASRCPRKRKSFFLSFFVKT